MWCGEGEEPVALVYLAVWGVERGRGSGSAPCVEFRCVASAMFVEITLKKPDALPKRSLSRLSQNQVTGLSSLKGSLLGLPGSRFLPRWSHLQVTEPESIPTPNASCYRQTESPPLHFLDIHRQAVNSDSLDKIPWNLCCPPTQMALQPQLRGGPFRKYVWPEQLEQRLRGTRNSESQEGLCPLGGTPCIQAPKQE
jgi:hypothetical protein